MYTTYNAQYKIEDGGIYKKNYGWVDMLQLFFCNLLRRISHKIKSTSNVTTAFSVYIRFYLKKRNKRKKNLRNLFTIIIWIRNYGFSLKRSYCCRAEIVVFRLWKYLLNYWIKNQITIDLFSQLKPFWLAGFFLLLLRNCSYLNDQDLINCTPSNRMRVDDFYFS